MTGFQLYGTIVFFSTIGIIAVCLIIYAVLMRKRHYRCPYCGQRFKDSTIKTFFSFNGSVDKVLTCPSCGKTGTMQHQHDEDYKKEQEQQAAEQDDTQE